jgi:hypothetical protein
VSELRLPVNPPKCCTVHGRRPIWEKAWADGGPGSFDPKYPYLHLPYYGDDMGEEEDDWCATRVWWNRRQYPELKRKRIKAVRLEKDGETWVWVIDFA